MSDNSELTFAKAVYKVTAAVGDTNNDPDKMPDLVGVSGTWLLRPRINRILLTEAEIAETIVPSEIKGTFVDGFMTYNGDPFVWLPVAARLPGNLPLFLWDFSGEYRYENSIRIRDQFTFDLVTGTDLAPANLTKLRPLEQATGELVTKGDPGRGYSSVTISGNNLVFHSSELPLTETLTVPALVDAEADAAAAEVARAAAVVARTGAETARGGAETAAGASATSAGLSDASRAAAVVAKTAAETAKTNAETAETNAETAQGLAESARTAAQGFRDTASTHATNAGNAKTAAETARDLAQGYRDSALGYRDAASGFATTASGHATAAGTARTAAELAETHAETAETNAAASAVAAAQSAEDANDVVTSGVPNATSTVKGGVILPGVIAGELGGTYDHPSVVGFANKLDKQTGGAGTNRVYVRTSANADGTVLYASAATASAIIVRDASGRAAVANPSAAGDITNKGSVDTLLALKAPLASPTFTGTVSGITAAMVGAPSTAERNAVNGYAGLDSSGLIPSTLLPGSVDEVIEAANFAALPGTGLVSKLYLTLNDNRSWRWSGSAYVEISPSPGSTDSVPEGSVNLYYTQTRADARVTAGLTGRTITTTAPLSGGGNLSADRTISITAGGIGTSLIADDGVTGAKLADYSIPYDIFFMAGGKDTIRAAGTLDNPFGIKISQDCQIKAVTYRCATADASGNLAVELRKNGVAEASSQQSLAAANQVAGTALTGLSINLVAGDILTVQVTGVGTTPGKGLVADIVCKARNL